MELFRYEDRTSLTRSDTRSNIPLCMCRSLIPRWSIMRVHAHRCRDPQHGRQNASSHARHTSSACWSSHSMQVRISAVDSPSSPTATALHLLFCSSLLLLAWSNLLFELEPDSRPNAAAASKGRRWQAEGCPDDANRFFGYKRCGHNNSKLNDERSVPGEQAHKT